MVREVGSRGDDEEGSVVDRWIGLCNLLSSIYGMDVAVQSAVMYIWGADATWETGARSRAASRMKAFGAAR